MLSNIRRLLFVPLALITTSVICQATTFTYNQTITLDPNLISTNGSGITTFNQFIPGTSPLPVQAGDVITGTINFSNGPITLQGQANTVMQAIIFFDAAPAGSISLTGTSSSTLLNYSGNLTQGANWTGNSSGSLSAAAAQFGAPYQFSFTGWAYTIDITSVTIGGNPASGFVKFDDVGFQANSISFASATPEPATVGLAGFACLAVAFAGRRRATV